MKRIRLFFPAIAVLLVTSLVLTCSSTDDDDTSGTNERNYGSVEGAWSFTLSPQEDSEGSADESEDVVLYETDGVITGYVEFFVFHGSRTGDEMVIDVIRQTETTNSHESTMRLTMTSDDRMSGTGTITYPAIDLYYEQDGTVHTKFTEENEEWDGGEASVHFFNIEAERLGDAPTLTKNALPSLPYRQISINWCSLLNGLERVPLFVLRGIGDPRPFGNCGITHDGGGSYLSGRDGPGTKYPYYSTTEYYAFEYSWCHVRGYSFHIRIKGEIDRWDVVKEMRDNNDDFLAPEGMSLDDYIQGFENFRDNYGGFAVCTGYSSHSHNMSVYLLTVEDHSRHTVLEDPWMKAVYDDITHGWSSDDLWVFGGKNIHDTWNMRRSLSTICNSYIDYTYIIGTHEVNFD